MNDVLLGRRPTRTGRYATGDKAIVAIKIDRNVEAVNSAGPARTIGARENDGIVKRPRLFVGFTLRYREGH